MCPNQWNVSTEKGRNVPQPMKTLDRKKEQIKQAYIFCIRLSLYWKLKTSSISGQQIKFLCDLYDFHQLDCKTSIRKSYM